MDRNVLQYTQTYWNIPKYTKIYQNIPKYAKIYPNIPKYAKIFQNIRFWCAMFLSFLFQSTILWGKKCCPIFWQKPWGPLPQDAATPQPQAREHATKTPNRTILELSTLRPQTRIISIIFSIITTVTVILSNATSTSTCLTASSKSSSSSRN